MWAAGMRPHREPLGVRSRGCSKMVTRCMRFVHMRRKHPRHLVLIWNEGLDTWDNAPSSNTESGRQGLCMR